MNKKEIDLLCESGKLLDVELSDEEVYSVDGSLLEPQQFLQFVKKYNKVLHKRTVEKRDECRRLFYV